MTKYTPEYYEKYKTSIKASQKKWRAKKKQEGTAVKGKKYTPEFYEKYKASIKAAQKKWQAKKRQEGIAAGTILSREQKLINSILKRTQYKLAITEKYQNNTDGFKDRAKAYYKDRYDNDPAFRESRLAYFREWRKKNK
jgi:hypothetical protein